MNTQNKRLLPYRNYDPHDVINGLYSLDRYSEFGLFVKVGSANLDDADGIVADSFGAEFDRTLSPHWGVKQKVTPITSGDTKYDVLGITLKSVLETDENGMPLKFYARKRDELNAVVSGKAVPIATRGLFTLGVDAYQVTGATPSAANGIQANVGDVLVPSNSEEGKVDIVPLTSIVANPSGATQYGENQIIGKVISTGSLFDGCVQVIFNPNS